ncbi:uncharacterized protein L969DRAFT_52465, partial [Mixia osmundae IAM 14324]|uniref:uncharacterized protein n=1 Tax=Mixia osmundae (strain CBS 9802 / IAM 14324 / JCM 22182 / KY 12970) TaxID=764103 RepID=UPI0004A54660
AFPNNSTLGGPLTEHWSIRVTNGVVTLFDAVFQQTLTRSSTEHASRDYNSTRQHGKQISNLSSFLFTRRY